MRLLITFCAFIGSWVLLALLFFYGKVSANVSLFGYHFAQWHLLLAFASLIGVITFQRAR